MAGDCVALRLCIDRLVPARRERPINFQMPPLVDARDAPNVMAAIIQAVANGEITPGEGASLTRLVEGWVQAIELADFDRRLEAVEAKQNAS